MIIEFVALYAEKSPHSEIRYFPEGTSYMEVSDYYHEMMKRVDGKMFDAVECGHVDLRINRRWTMQYVIVDCVSGGRVYLRAVDRNKEYDIFQWPEIKKRPKRFKLTRTL